MGTSWSEGGEHTGRAGAGDPLPGSGASSGPCIPLLSHRHEELLQKGGVYAGMWLQQQTADEGESKEHRTEKPQGSKKGS